VLFQTWHCTNQGVRKTEVLLKHGTVPTNEKRNLQMKREKLNAF